MYSSWLYMLIYAIVETSKKKNKKKRVYFIIFNQKKTASGTVEIYAK